MVVLNILKDLMDLTVRNLQRSIPVSVSKIKSSAFRAAGLLSKRKKGFPSVISIIFVGAKRMRGVNRRYLGHDYVTDIITFDFQGVAELVICPQEALKNARAYQVDLHQELVLYVIHGLLHLAGYDDHSAADIKQMRLWEEKLLKKVL